MKHRAWLRPGAVILPLWLAACAPLPPTEPAASRLGANELRYVQAEERLIATEAASIQARAIALAAASPSGIDPARWRETVELPEQALLKRDVLITRRFEALHATLNWEGRDKQTAVHAALVEWTSFVRRASMSSWHTRVPGLVDDPVCAGDLFADGMLLRYFDAITDDDDAARAAAIAALTDIGRQSACLGAEQSERLAQTMVDAYELMRLGILARHRTDDLLLATQALASPLLLFLDIEKYKGASAPLVVWFAEQAQLLRLGVVSSRIPAVWHGLWLYDRRSGRMLGFRHTVFPADENDVDLRRLFDSIASRRNLLDGSCSLAEMVLRGATTTGYFCAGTTCRRTAENGEPAPHDGTDEICDATVGGSGGSGASGGLCGDGLQVAGASEGAKAVRCLSAQVVRPGTAGLSCVAEATGMCSDPVSRLVKKVSSQAYAGAIPGKLCRLAAKDDRASQAWDRYEGAAAAARERYDENVDVAKRAVAGVVADYATARAAWDKTSAAVARGEMTKEDEKAAYDAERAAAEYMYKVIEEARVAVEEFAKQRDKALQAAQQARNAETEGGSARCAQEDTCGNACSAVSQAMLRTLSCVNSALDPPQRDPYGTHADGCNPTICDPVDSPSGSGARMCLSGVDELPTARVARGCWTMRCANNQVASRGTDDLCSCSAASNWSLTNLRNPCELMRCTGDGTGGAGLIVGATFGTGCACLPVDTVTLSTQGRPDLGGMLSPPGLAEPFIVRSKTVSEVNPLVRMLRPQ